MRTRVGLGKLLPVRSAITRCSDATESGPSSSRRTSRSSPAVPSQERSASDRSETITSHRAAREPPRCEGEGRGGGRVEPVRVVDREHDRPFGRERAEQRQQRRSRPAAARPAARSPSGSTATSSACRCGGGRSSKLPGSSSASRSVRPANESVASDSAGRAARTQRAELAAPAERPLPRRRSCRSRARRRSRARPRLRTPRGTPRPRKARARARRAWTRPEGTPTTTRTPSTNRAGWARSGGACCVGSAGPGESGRHPLPPRQARGIVPPLARPLSLPLRLKKGAGHSLHSPHGEELAQTPAL